MRTPREKECDYCGMRSRHVVRYEVYIQRYPAHVTKKMNLCWFCAKELNERGFIHKRADESFHVERLP